MLREKWRKQLFKSFKIISHAIKKQRQILEGRKGERSRERGREETRREKGKEGKGEEREEGKKERKRLRETFQSFQSLLE